MPDIDTLLLSIGNSFHYWKFVQEKGKQTVKKDRVPDKKIEPNQNLTLEDVFKGLGHQESTRIHQ